MKGKVSKIVISFIKTFAKKAQLLHAKYSKSSGKKPSIEQKLAPMRPQLVQVD